MLKTIWGFAKKLFFGAAKLIAKPFIWIGTKLGLVGGAAVIATAAEPVVEATVEAAVEAGAETAVEAGAETAVEGTMEFICGLLG